MAAKTPQSKNLQQTLSDLRSKDGVEIGAFSDFNMKPVGMTTGNLTLDALTGIGGFPKGRVTELVGPPSSGKAQRWTDVVHTPDRGFVQIKDLAVGDRVSSPTNEPSKVMGIFPQGDRDLYRIRFSDGTAAVCSYEHLWGVEVNAPGLGYVYTVVSTTRLLRAMQAKSYREKDIRLPSVEPVEADPQNLPLDPYLLGALIGDGGLTQGSVMLTTMDAEIVERVKSVLPAEVALKFAAEAGKAKTYRLSTGNTGQRVKNPVVRALRDMGLMGHGALTKFIPKQYLAGSVEQRLSLVQGLMDTDGYEPITGAKVFYTSSPQLAEDFALLVRSLGCPAYIRSKSPTMSENRAYRVEFRTDLSVLTVARKVRGIAPTRLRSRKFVSVEHVGREDCVCIKVSAPSELYLTNDFIPTHNTTSALQAAAQCQQRGGIVFYADYERALDPVYCAALGLDVHAESFLYAKPEYFEKGANAFRRLVRTGEIDMGIFDSVATMVTQHELEAETGAVQVADRAKMMHQFLRQLNPELSQYNVAAVFLNHIMELVDATPMGRKLAAQGIKRKTSPGGRALPFYSSLRIEFNQIGNLRTKEMDLLNNEEQDIVTQTKVEATVIKNKVAPTVFRKAELRVRFGKGFSQPFSVLNVLTAHKVVKKSGAWFTFPEKLRLDLDDDNAKLQGEDNVLSLMEANPEWMAVLEAAAYKVVEQLGAEAFDAVDGTDFTKNEEAEYDFGADPMTGEIK